MALCGLCRPSHERLLDSCYPSNKVLSSSSHPGNVKPSSNELGRLAFLCANAPAAKLAKVTTLLQTRAARQAKHATRNAKYKSQLCISLDILNRLSEDCRPILTAAAPAALEIIASALTVPDTSGSAAGYSASGGSWDSTVVEHAASAFATLAALADASCLGLDHDLSQAYIRLLSTWSNIATQPYEKNAANASNLRMLGLYALSASFSADAFDSTVPEQQIQASLPALLSNLSQPAATLMVLNEELANIDERTKASTSKENKPFQRIPLEKRKAPSFRKEHHGQVEKEKQSHDVMHQSLLVLRLLIQRSKAKQMECILATTLDWLDQRTERWENVEWCCWLAQTLTRFSQIQHRFGIVSALLDKLTHTPQEPQPSAQQVTLLSMITAVLTGPTALLGLGLGEVLTSFVGVIAQRATYGLQDPFLPALIDGTASLASRLYYLDQISDLVQDIILALRSLPLPSKDVSNQQRSTHGVAVLKCLIGVLERSPHLAVGSDNNRSHISPELWSKSLFLCTDPDPAIRFTYSHALLLYIRHELPATLLQQHDNVDASSARKELFDALALAAYKLALSQFTAEKPTSSSSSSTRSNRSASHPPDHSKGTTSPPANENAAAANLDDFAALQQVMLASVNSASPEATLSLIPMLSALLSSGQTLQPELTAVYRELISSSLTAAIAAWSDATPTSFEKTSAIPPLRSLEDGASNGTLAELALTHNGPSEDAELPSVEDLAKSSKLQEATKCSFGILLATLKEPWTAIKAAEHNMGVRTRPIASPASNTRLKSPSQASFKNPSVSDLRASLIVTGPAHLHVDGADGSPATIKRHSHQRTGTPDSLMVQGGSQTSPRRSIATASPASPSGTAEATVSPSRAASPSKPSPLRA